MPLMTERYYSYSILKMAKGQILDFFRMIEKNVIPLTSIQTAYVVGQTAGCELGNINAHYYIEYTIESLDVERLEQMINLVISKNDAIFEMPRKDGIYTMASYLEKYQVLDELKKIDKFKSEGKI